MRGGSVLIRVLDSLGAGIVTDLETIPEADVFLTPRLDTWLQLLIRINEKASKEAGERSMERHQTGTRARFFRTCAEIPATIREYRECLQEKISSDSNVAIKMHQ